MPIQTSDVLIIGSGLAGMTAAVELTEHNTSLRVLESNPFIGGRTSSWNEDGMEIESGLHRFLGFYVELPKILKKVGIDINEMLCWEDEIEIRMPDGVQATLGMAPFFKPGKTIAAALGHNDFLSPADKLHLSAMFTAGLKDYVTDPEKLDRITVAEYCDQHNVSERAFLRIIYPLTEGIFFVRPEKYSMHNFIGLFAPFIPYLAKTRVGAFTGGMSTVMMQPMADFVTKKGGDIHIDQKVSKLIIKDGHVIGARTKTTEYRAHQVILAASLAGAKSIISSSFEKSEPFNNILALPTMPAVTFQLELTAPSIDADRTTFGPTTIMASFSEQSRTTFQGSKGRLSVILAQPEKYIDLPAGDILDLVVADAQKLGINLVGKIKDFRKVSLPADFYSLAPGNEHLRPPQETSISGLTLAGDYTKQKHLATMEGAVVSGQRAAKLVAQYLHKD